MALTQVLVTLVVAVGCCLGRNGATLDNIGASVIPFSPFDDNILINLKDTQLGESDASMVADLGASPHPGSDGSALTTAINTWSGIAVNTTGITHPDSSPANSNGFANEGTEAAVAGHIMTPEQLEAKSALQNDAEKWFAASGAPEAVPTDSNGVSLESMYPETTNATTAVTTPGPVSASGVPGSHGNIASQVDSDADKVNEAVDAAAAVGALSPEQLKDMHLQRQAATNTSQTNGAVTVSSGVHSTNGVSLESMYPETTNATTAVTTSGPGNMATMRNIHNPPVSDSSPAIPNEFANEGKEAAVAGHIMTPEQLETKAAPPISPTSDALEWFAAAEGETNGAVTNRIPAITAGPASGSRVQTQPNTGAPSLPAHIASMYPETTAGTTAGPVSGSRVQTQPNTGALSLPAEAAGVVPTHSTDSTGVDITSPAITAGPASGSDVETQPNTGVPPHPAGAAGVVQYPQSTLLETQDSNSLSTPTPETLHDAAQKELAQANALLGVDLG
jgi:hypothetical protein